MTEALLVAKPSIKVFGLRSYKIINELFYEFEQLI